jgi:hypothetical protein
MELKYLKRFNENIDKGLRQLGVSTANNPSPGKKPDSESNTSKNTVAPRYSFPSYTSTFNDPFDYTKPHVNTEIVPEVTSNFDRIERFIRQANRIISGEFKIKKDKSVLENLFTLCDNIKIGPEEIRDIMKSKRVNDDKNYLANLYEDLRGLYSEDWSEEY